MLMNFYDPQDDLVVQYAIGTNNVHIEIRLDYS